MKNLFKWLENKHRQQIMDKAIERAMTRFTQSQPRWADSLMDGFLLRHCETLCQNGRIEPQTLAEAWTEQLPYQDEAKKQKHIKALMPLTAELLSILNQEMGKLAIPTPIQA